jgi:hypothetical protein
VLKPDDEVVDERAVSNFIQLVDKCQDMVVLNDCTEQEATVLLEELQEQEDAF